MIFHQILLTSSILGECFKNILHLRNRCNSLAKLDGKVAVVTGANTGLGKETAYQLTLRGAKTIIACRDVNKGETAVNDIKAKNPLADISVSKLDLSSLTSVRQFVKKLSESESKVDLLINNAGIRRGPELETEDGFELHFGSTYLGHFLLTLSLMSLLKNSSNARVINISTKAYMTGQIHLDNINLRNGAYSPGEAYCQSKLAMILFTRELAKRLGSNSNVKAYTLHPGVFENDASSQTIGGRFFKNINMILPTEMGAQTTLYCALEENIENESGSYYDNCNRVDRLLTKAKDDETAEKLWELSCDLAQIDEHLRLEAVLRDGSVLDQGKQHLGKAKISPLNDGK